MIRLLAARGIGIYFISEDIFTTASYYQHDLLDEDFLPPGFPLFPEENGSSASIPETEFKSRLLRI